AGDGAHPYVGAVENRITRLRGQLTIAIQEPKQRMRIQQEPHGPLPESGACSPSEKPVGQPISSSDSGSKKRSPTVNKPLYRPNSRLAGFPVTARSSTTGSPARQ